MPEMYTCKQFVCTEKQENTDVDNEKVVRSIYLCVDIDNAGSSRSNGACSNPVIRVQVGLL